MIGLDTTALIDLFRGDESIRKMLLQQTEPFAVTQLTYLEIMFGLDPESPQHQREKECYDELFGSLFSLSLTNAACVKASEFFWKMKKRGVMIGKFDGTIAAIFLVNGVSKIITRNKKHFEQIPGMRVLSY